MRNENLIKYQQLFREVLELEDNFNLDEATVENVENWDSFLTLCMIDELENAFNIRIEGNDVLKLTSYINGKKLLEKHNL